MLQSELQRAEEEVQVASARLAQPVRWEYTQLLQPVESHLHPITVVNNHTPTQSLVSTGFFESHAHTSCQWLQIQTAQEAVSAAQESFYRNWNRIENGQGLPIEVLQSIQSLTNAQRGYTRAVTDCNVANFTLHRSLGRLTIYA